MKLLIAVGVLVCCLIAISLVKPFGENPDSSAASSRQVEPKPDLGTSAPDLDLAEITPEARPDSENDVAVDEAMSAELLIALAPSAAAAVAQIRSQIPSKDAEDALLGLLIACASSKTNATGKAPGGTIVKEWELAHVDQTRRFASWCGDLELLKLAHADAKRNSRPGNSDQELAAALVPDGGKISTEKLPLAVELMFKTESLAIMDALALELFSSTLEPEHSARLGDNLQYVHSAHLAAAMVYCRNQRLCAPNSPRTMLDCASYRLCAPGQGLLEFRYSLANDFERRLAEQMVADWSRHRKPRNK